MTFLPTTLLAAGLAAIINVWLAIRVGQVRGSQKVSIGDGGNDAVIRRMRAHANFVEFTPFFILLVGAIELARGAGNPTWLFWVVIAYMVGRIAHAFGMDDVKYGRAIGTMVTMLSLIGLGLFALFLAYTGQGEISAPTPADLNSAEVVPLG